MTNYFILDDLTIITNAKSELAFMKTLLQINC
jgi:hypothetical protein